MHPVNDLHGSHMVKARLNADFIHDHYSRIFGRIICCVRGLIILVLSLG